MRLFNVGEGIVNVLFLVNADSFDDFVLWFNKIKTIYPNINFYLLLKDELKAYKEFVNSVYKLFSLVVDLTYDQSLIDGTGSSFKAIFPVLFEEGEYSKDLWIGDEYAKWILENFEILTIRMNEADKKRIERVISYINGR